MNVSCLFVIQKVLLGSLLMFLPARWVVSEQFVPSTREESLSLDVALISHKSHRLLQDPRDTAERLGWDRASGDGLVHPPCSKQGQTGCPWLCLDGFCVSPRMDTHRFPGQHIYLQSDENHVFLMFDQSFSFSCPRHHWEGPQSVSCTLSFRYLCTWIRSPWAFSRLKIPHLSASPCIPDSPSLKSPFWPFAGLTPVYPCLSCTRDLRTGSPKWISWFEVL